MNSQINVAVQKIKKEIENAPSTWILGYSGGKDSTALLIITLRALDSLKKIPCTFKLIVTYCDTGVEIPVVRDLTKRQINKFKQYCEKKNLPILFRISQPRLEDRYFVKIIGRGYVPPTNKFRWCTDRLRISPVERLIKKYCTSDTKILLGVRHGESVERDRIIEKHKKKGLILIQSATGRQIFAPILHLTVTDVWNVIIEAEDILEGAQYKLLAQYRNASGECPMIRDPRSNPCAQGRFGCWTCTVVRKDKSVTNLIISGQEQLQPLLNFRNWLAVIRDQAEYRESHRRNGAKGPGPFTINARKAILKKLKKAEKESGYKLIFKSELKIIKQLWVEDTAKT